MVVSVGFLGACQTCGTDEVAQLKRALGRSVIKKAAQPPLPQEKFAKSVIFFEWRRANAR